MKIPKFIMNSSSSSFSSSSPIETMKIPKLILNSSFFSTSSIPPEEHQGLSTFDNLVSIRRELSNICPPRIRTVNEPDDSADEKVGLDEVYLSIVRCPICQFDIEVYSRRGHPKDYETCNMICPVCDEKFGDDVIRIVRNTSYPILGKKSGVSNIGWEIHDEKKDCSWGTNAPINKDILYSLSSGDFSSDDEDTISNASDVTGAKEISGEKSSEAEGVDVGDEQKLQEGSNKAAFSQELLMSAILIE